MWTLYRRKTMSNEDKALDIERSFGVGVLLKLIKKNVKGVEISTDGERFSSNMSVRELSKAADTVLETHHIKIKADT